MNHLSEEQLILFHYDESDGAIERSSMEQHLASCPVCRSRYDDPTVPERSEAYGQEVWQRLRPRLMERPGSAWADFFAPRRWALAGAFAALIVVAFLAGRYGSHHEMEANAAISPQARERILLVAVGDHLDRSQMVLVELTNADSKGPVDISSEQRTARDLVDANRLYRQTAARAGEVGVASVLDDLERVLIEVANSPSKLSSAQFEDIRQRIEAKGILFKIRVIDSQVREREKTGAPESPGNRT